MAFAQSMRLVHAAGQHDVAELSRLRLGMVGIGTYLIAQSLWY